MKGIVQKRIKKFHPPKVLSGVETGLPITGKCLKGGAMKRFTLLSVLFAFGLGACERHDFEETKRLHGHGDSHAEHAEDGALH